MSTLKEIAQKAGVSSALISAYLNGRASARMRMETRARIDSALRETGYSPNPLARALRTGKSGIIGYLTSSLQNEVSQQELILLNEIAAARGYRIINCYTRGEYLELVKGCQELLHYGCEGLIVNSINHPKTWEYCRALPLPVVGICRNPEWKTDDSLIVLDYYPGVESALSYLAERDFHQVLFLSTPWDNLECDPRYCGFQRFFPDGAYEILERTEMTGTAWLEAILARHPECNAFFCGNDYSALAAWGALNELGYRVPQDIALIGFDDLPSSAALHLASICKPQKAMMENALTLLCNQLEQRSDPVVHAWKTEFVPRYSCQCTAAAAPSALRA